MTIFNNLKQKWNFILKLTLISFSSMKLINILLFDPVTLFGISTLMCVVGYQQTGALNLARTADRFIQYKRQLAHAR